jgi:hypothetical protein
MKRRSLLQLAALSALPALSSSARAAGLEELRLDC